MIRAFCWPSGLIDFGKSTPKGCTVIARGHEQVLREFITSQVQRGDLGRIMKVYTGHMFVPGTFEAKSQSEWSDAIGRWCRWISNNAPKGVRVVTR